MHKQTANGLSWNLAFVQSGITNGCPFNFKCNFTKILIVRLYDKTLISRIRVASHGQNVNVTMSQPSQLDKWNRQQHHDKTKSIYVFRQIFSFFFLAAVLQFCFLDFELCIVEMLTSQRWLLHFVEYLHQNMGQWDQHHHLYLRLFHLPFGCQ